MPRQKKIPNNTHPLSERSVISKSRSPIRDLQSTSPDPHMLRISQVWNEITENWQPRGTWLFLELIEEYDQETHLGVSMKQIWYDLRDKTCFDKIKEWTCMMRDLWKGLVLQVINENLNIILKHVFKVLECSGGLFQETNGALELARTDVGVDISSEADLADALAIVPVENSFCSDM